MKGQIVECLLQRSGADAKADKIGELSITILVDPEDWMAAAESMVEWAGEAPCKLELQTKPKDENDKR